MVIWIIGLSGAGKSTIGRILADQLRQKHKNLVYLDGDELRDVWGDSLGYTVKGREKNAARISHLCHMLDSQGLNVVTAVLSIFPEWQKWIRETFSSYFEIFLDVPFDTVEARDTKGLYKAARNDAMKDVVGIDIPFPAPSNPDLIIRPPEVLEAPEAIVQNITDLLPTIEVND